MKSNSWLDWLDFFLPKHLSEDADNTLEKIEGLRKAKIIIRFSLACFFLGQLMFILRYLLEPANQQAKSLFLLPIIAIITGSQAFVLKFTGSTRLPAWNILIVGFFIFLVRANATGGINSAVAFWYGILPVVSMLLLSRKESILVFIMTVFFMSLSTQPAWFEGTIFQINQATHLPMVSLAVKFCGLGIIFAVSYAYEVERVKSAKALQIAEQTIAQSNKLASLAVLSGGVAHEINNPLSTILGNLTKLDMHYRKAPEYPPVVKESFEVIIRNAERIQSIVSALRMFTRDDFHTQSRRVHLDKIIKNYDFQEKIETRIHKNIKVELDLEEQVFVNLHEELFTRVLENLVINSTDAIKDQTNPWIRIEVKKVNREVLMSFTDSGEGIPEDIQKKIFDPFFTTKGVGEGTGLGLALVKRIVEAFQGSFSYNSDSSHTQFIIKLPISAVD